MEKEKSKNKSFIIKFSIFSIILIIGTCIGIYYTIKYLNKTMIKDDELSIDMQEDIKSDSSDDIYAIKSYSETYNTNSIKITNYIDIDGKIFTDETINQIHDYNYNTRIGFIQIEGLKETQVQDRVNREIKQVAYSLQNENDKDVYCYVCGNFSNILSVNIHTDNKEKGLNFNLVTGEQIPFEKVFISSAPINLFLMDALNKKLAWRSITNGEEDLFDMDQKDMSALEDKALLLFNKYKKTKNNISYNISYDSVNIIDLLDSNITGEIEDEERNDLTINLIDYSQYVAIYKRYLTNESIFTNNNLGKKNIVILTEPLDDKVIQEIAYGKIANNIFMEDILINNSGNVYNEGIVDFVKKLSEESKNKLIENNDNNKGIFFQTEYQLSEEYINQNFTVENTFDYYCIYATRHKATCSIEYFNREGFKDYIKIKMLPRADVGLNTFTEYLKEEFPNFEIREDEEPKRYYISKLGEFLGNTEEDAKKQLNIEMVN